MTDRYTHGDCSLVHSTSASCKVNVHDDGHGKRSQVHEHGGSNKQSCPHPRLGDFDLFLAVFGPVVGEVDKEDQADEQKEAGTNHGKVIAPYDEERIRDEEGQDHKGQPGDDLWTPESVLDGGAAILGAPHADEHHGHDDVEESECEVDALHRDVAVTLLAVALDVDVIQGEVREFLHSPIGEHYPGDDGIEQEEEGVCDTGSDTVSTFAAARSKDGAAGGCSAARCGDAPELVRSAAHTRRDGGGLLTPPTLGMAIIGMDRSAPMVAVSRSCVVGGV